MAQRPLKFDVGLRRFASGTRKTTVSSGKEARKAFRQLTKNMTRVTAAIERATPGAIKFAQDLIFWASQHRVPVEFGPLKESGYSEVVSRRGQHVGEVGYAKGGKPDYAIFVHEDLEAHHDAPTRAKYLQSAVEEHIGDIPDRIKQFLEFP